MADQYFANFPVVNYRGTITRNLISRARFVQSTFENYLVYYPFVVADGQSVEEIADKYYGSPDYDWIVYFSNKVFDPYYFLPLTQSAFEDYLLKKYGDIETAMTTIHHYVYNSIVEDYLDPNLSYTDGYEMSPTTYSFLTTVQQSSWRPVSVYEWEDKLNEDKRTIQLIDRRLLPQIMKEIGEIMH